MKLARDRIVAFLEGTVIYALSKQWEDLMSMYMLGLHAVPYCGVELLACSAYVEMPVQSATARRLIAEVDRGLRPPCMSFTQRLAGRAEGRILADALCWACSRHRCSPEAPAASQFLYVVGLLLLTAFVQTWAIMGPSIYHYKIKEAGKNIREKIVPKMMGMWLGWALGNAFKARPAQNRHASGARVRQSLTSRSP